MGTTVAHHKHILEYQRHKGQQRKKTEELT